MTFGTLNGVQNVQYEQMAHIGSDQFKTGPARRVRLGFRSVANGKLLVKRRH
jgi:hypothetical protein